MAGSRLRVLMFASFAFIFIALALPMGTAAAGTGGEELVYALRYESLNRDPDVVHTTVHGFNPRTGVTRVVYTDRDAAIMLIHKRGLPGCPGDVLVCAGDKLYAHAVERGQNPGRWFASPAAVYELNGGGARKICAVRGDQALDNLAASGEKIAYLNYDHDQISLFVHDRSTGALLRQTALGGFFLDCLPAALAWRRDGTRLIFSLDAGCDDCMSEESRRRIGVYQMGYGETAPIPFLPGDPGAPAAPRFAGEAPDGSLLFIRWGRQADGGAYVRRLALVDAAGGAKREIVPAPGGHLRTAALSPSGAFLAYMTEEPGRTGANEWSARLWLRDLRTGTERLVYVLDNRPFRGFYLGLIGWMGGR